MNLTLYVQKTFKSQGCKSAQQVLLLLLFQYLWNTPNNLIIIPKCSYVFITLICAWFHLLFIFCSILDLFLVIFSIGTLLVLLSRTTAYCFLKCALHIYKDLCHDWHPGIMQANIQTHYFTRCTGGPQNYKL